MSIGANNLTPVYALSSDHCAKFSENHLVGHFHCFFVLNTLALFVFLRQNVLKLACSRTLPFWWDDVSDCDTLEALAVQAFNQVKE